MIDLRFNMEDASQVIIGSFSLAVPIAFTQEAWKLGETLPAANLVMVVVLSLVVLSLFAYHSVFGGRIEKNLGNFIGRLLLGYLLSLLVVAIVLLVINRLPIIDDPWIAVKRVLVIGMPSSMGAIVVDSFDKESWSS